MGEGETETDRKREAERDKDSERCVGGEGKWERGKDRGRER